MPSTYSRLDARRLYMGCTRLFEALAWLWLQLVCSYQILGGQIPPYDATDQLLLCTADYHLSSMALPSLGADLLSALRAAEHRNHAYRVLILAVSTTAIRALMHA